MTVGYTGGDRERLGSTGDMFRGWQQTSGTKNTYRGRQGMEGMMWIFIGTVDSEINRIA